jgi:endonuclease VIII
VRLWVYGRAGKACLECGTAIETFLQGEMARRTWWCRGCQDVSPGGPAGL